MSRPIARLRSLVAQLLAGNIAFLVSQFCMLLVLARSVSVAEVGLYAWGLAIAAPIFILANLRLQQIQSTHREGEFTFGDFVIQRAAALTVAWVVVITIVAGLASTDNQVQMLLAVSAYRTFDSLIEISNGHLIRNELMLSVSAIQSVRAVMGLVVFASAVEVTSDPTAAVWWLACFTASTFVLTLFVLKRSPLVGRLGAVGGRRVMRLTAVAFPLGLAFFIGALTVNVPRYVIESRLGVVELGVFAAAAYLIVLANTVIDTALAATLPRLAQAVGNGDRSAFIAISLRLCYSSVVLGVFGILVALVSGEWFLRTIYGPEYTSGRMALVWLCIAAALQYVSSTFRTSGIAAGYVRAPLPIALVNGLVTIGLCLLFVESHGLAGVAAGFAGGQVIAAIAYGALFSRSASSTRWGAAPL